MTSRELVLRTMKGEYCGRTPVYGWVRFELEKPITERFGSVENFEDHYRFDLAHIFGGPWAFGKCLEGLTGPITPEMLLDIPFDPIHTEDYEGLIQSMAHHRQRDRFCYVQTPGIFEALNSVFGIENHLLYMALCPEELTEVYRKMADWNIENGKNLLDLGVDGIHVSDDWGSQRSMLFSPQMFRDMIFPCHKRMLTEFKKGDALVSLHSDSCIRHVLDDVVELGYDFIHPWQESAGMPYDLYLQKYQDKFGILGGVCIQTTLGFGDIPRVDSEIRRVFSLLKGKRWACCTTHFVESTCSMDELCYAYDLIRRLADEP